MTAYWLGRARISDPETFGRYVERAPAIIRAHGGVFAGAGQSRVLEGAPDFEHFFVIEFPTFEAAVACHSSDAYREATRLREGTSTVEIVLVDGGDLPAQEPA